MLQSTTTEQQGEVKRIPIDKISVPGKNPRGMMDDDHVMEIAGSMQRNGQLQSITVEETSPGEYELIAGFHRVAAAMRNHWTEILATVRQPNGKSNRVLSLTENLIRKDMTLQEEIEAVIALGTTELMSPSMICDFLNRSRAWVDARLAAPSLPTDIKIPLFEGRLTLTKAQIISRVKDEGMRAQIINQVTYGRLTQSQTEELVAMYEATPSMADAIRAGIETPPQSEEASQIQRPCTICATLRGPLEIIYVPICKSGCPKKG